jgi:hypothetical protein
MENKNIFINSSDRYVYEVQLTDCKSGSISIIKRFNTGNDPRDQIAASLTFKLEDYLEITRLIALYLPKEQNGS